MIANYNPNPFFNHGYWTFSKTNPTPFNGIYRLTMNNIGYNNNAGFNGWTVAKADIAADPNLTASWSLIGQCAIASTATVTLLTQQHYQPAQQLQVQGYRQEV